MLPVPAPAVLTIDETAETLRVSRQTVHALINRGELRRYKIGRSTRLNRREVLALIGVDDDAA